MKPPKSLINLPIGEKNPYGKYFTGQSYLHILTKEQIFVQLLHLSLNVETFGTSIMLKKKEVNY